MPGQMMLFSFPCGTKIGEVTWRTQWERDLGLTSNLIYRKSPGSSFSTSFPLPRFLIFPLSFSLALVIAYVLCCVWLFATLCSPPGSSVHGIFQASILEQSCHFLLQHYTKGGKDEIKCFREKNSRRCLPLESPHVSAIHHVLFLQISSFI